MPVPRPILVVDDDSDLREAIGELLCEEGYPTRLFESGSAALEALRAGERPQLILLDLVMPGMSGWEFLEAQLRDDALRDIPVVVLTASHGAPARRIAAQEVLLKPVALGDLMQAVERNAR